VISPFTICLGDNGFEHYTAENLKLTELCPETGAVTIREEKKAK
jgi:hypothetical protein